MSSKKLLCRNDSYAAPARARNAKLESSFAERALSLGAANASGMPPLPGARLCYRRVPVAPLPRMQMEINRLALRGKRQLLSEGLLPFGRGVRQLAMGHYVSLCSRCALSCIG